MARLHWVLPSFWRSLWIALRRAKFDPKARKNLQRLGLYLFFILGLLGLQIARFTAMGVAWALLIIPLIALIPTTVYLVQKIYQFIRSRIERVKSFRAAEKTPETSDYLFRLTYQVAVLLDRAGSERAMEKELPPEIEVITRRVHLDKLKERNFRDEMRPWLRDLLLAPDGSWSEQQKSRILPMWEVFVVLRWLMFMGDLSHMTARSRYDYNDVRATLKLLDAGHIKLRPVWDVRLRRDITQNFMNRIWVESVARGLINVESADHKAEVQRVRERYLEAGYTGDYLIGIHTVAELPNESIWYLGRKCFLRTRTLAILVDLLSGDQPKERFEDFIEQEFSPQVSSGVENEAEIASDKLAQ